MFPKSCILKCIKKCQNESTTESFVVKPKSYRKKLKTRFFNFNKKQKLNLPSPTGQVISSTMLNENKSKISYWSVQRRGKETYSHNFDDFSDSMSEESDSDISFLSLSNEDLNSSMSSVSSLEFEPFESLNERQSIQNSYRKKSIVRTPLISSSRTSLQVSSQKKSLSFEPGTTSSRKSLALNPYHKENSTLCSICSTDSTNRNCSNCLENSDDSSSMARSGYFSFDEQNICSSTHISKTNQTNNTSSECLFKNSILSITSQSTKFSDYYF